MKLIKVPEDVDEIINLSDFKESIVEINKFQKNLTKFGDKILEKYVKRLDDWKKLLSEEDWKFAIFDEIIYKDDNGETKKYETKIDVEEKKIYGTYLYNYKTRKLSDFDVSYHGWIMGSISGKTQTISFSDCGNILIVKHEWQSKSVRFEHIPWKHHTQTLYIDFINNQILNCLPR